MSSSITPVSKSTTTIEDLPEPILLHIISLLYIEDAIGTSLVSRKFRNLWHFMPSLNFDLFEFYVRLNAPGRCSNALNQVFADFVSNTLLVRKPYAFNKFDLRFHFTKNDSRYYFVRNWIRYAINLSVSELILYFEYDRAIDRFEFHLSDIRDSRVGVLKVRNCFLIIPPRIDPSRYVSVKELELRCFNPFNGNDVCNLLARCVNLETLIFIEIEFVAPGGLIIHSATLKELYISDCWNSLNDYELSPLDLDICCPELQKISLIAVYTAKNIIKDTTQLVEACVDFSTNVDYEDYTKCWEKLLSYFGNISLHLWDELLESNEVPVGCEQYASNVKHVELCIAYNEIDIVGLAALLKLLPKLEILRIHDRKILHDIDTKDPKLRKDYWRAVFNMPCLRKVILKKYQTTGSAQHLIIELFKKNSVVLEKIELLDFSTTEN